MLMWIIVLLVGLCTVSFTFGYCIGMTKNIKTKITLSEFWANKGKRLMAIRCRSEYQAKKLLQAFAKRGQTWGGWVSYLTDTHWSAYKSKTVYLNNNGFTNMRWAKKQDIVIYEFDEVDLEG